MRALLRRAPPGDREQTLTYAGLSLDFLTRETRRGERRLTLGTTEFDLLIYLLRHPGHVLSLSAPAANPAAMNRFMVSFPFTMTIPTWARSL